MAGEQPDYTLGLRSVYGTEIGGNGCFGTFETPGPLGLHLLERASRSLEGLRVVSGARSLTRGPHAAHGTTYCAAIRGEGDVVLEARFDGPEMSGTDLDWVGGTPEPGHPHRRTVSRANFGRTTVSCRRGTARFAMVVYIIGAEPTEYRGDGGSHFADNEEGYPSPLGIHPITAATGAHADTCEIQYTVRPAELVADANAGRFDPADIQWDVSRDKQARYWRAATAPVGGLAWDLYDDRPFWHSDDSHDTEEDNNPWNGNGHIYGNDRPADTPSASAMGYVKKLRMREWVRVNIGGGAARLGEKCSDYQYWHIFRSLLKSGATWSQSNNHGGNEMRAGDPGWGASPPS